MHRTKLCLQAGAFFALFFLWLPFVRACRDQKAAREKDGRRQVERKTLPFCAFTYKRLGCAIKRSCFLSYKAARQGHTRSGACLWAPRRVCHAVNTQNRACPIEIRSYFYPFASDWFVLYEATIHPDTSTNLHRSAHEVP